MDPDEKDKPGEPVPYLYVVVRTDIPADKLLVNYGHACSECVTQAPIPKTTRLVLLGVKNEAELLEYADDARSKGFEPAVVYEPDEPYCGAAMSFGLISTRRNQLRKLFYHLAVVDEAQLRQILARSSEPHPDLS